MSFPLPVLLLALIGLALGLSSGCAHEQALIEANKKVAQGIDQTAEAIDIYAANDRYTHKRNQSRLVLYNGFSFTEGGERRYVPHLGIKLHLPNLQEKLQLRFTSYDEDAEERGINANRYQTEPEDRVYGSSLAFFQDLGKLRTEFRPRVEYLADKVQTSYLFRFWSDARRGAFTLEPEVQLFARSDTGTGQYLSLNSRLRLSPKDDLRLINEEQYTDGDNTMTTNHGVRWLHDYDRIFAHENAVIFESSNRATYHHERCVVSSTFRHRLRPNVLHYSLTPYLTFAKEVAFKPEAAFDARLELIF